MEYKWITRAVGIFAVCLGLLVILGWLANIDAFKSITSGFVSMKFNTALCFVFAGAFMLLYDNSEQIHLKHFLAIIIAITGSLTIVEYFGNFNLGIDLLFSKDKAFIWQPGRMAPSTALCFILLGISFFLINANRYKPVAQVLLHCISAISFIAALGYFLQVSMLYRNASFTPMAIHTSVTFLAISVASSLFNPTLGITGIFTGSSIGNRLTRTLFPRLLFSFLLLSFTVIEAYRNRILDAEYGLALFALGAIALGLLAIWSSAKLLNKIDRDKEQARSELIFANQNLEQLVNERTSELQTALNKLSQTNYLNRIFVNQSPNAIAMFDTNMRYIAASEKWVTDYGLTGREIIGVSHYDIFPEIGEDWKQHHRECLKGAINKCDEAPFERQDGTIQWITWDVRPWYISTEEIGGLLMYTSDITAIKEKDREKLRIEEILDKTNEVARIGTWEVDLKRKKIKWSRITREIHEVSADYEPHLEDAINFFNGDSKLAIQQAVTAAIETGKNYDIEVELTTAKGNIVWARAIGQVGFKNGVCEKLYGVFQDITDVKKSKETLYIVNEELNTILNAAYVSIIGTDVNGIITHFNKGAETLLQYSAAEMIGITTPAIIHVAEEVTARGHELSAIYQKPITGFDVFVEAARHAGHETREWTYVRKDGSTFPVQLVVTAITDQYNNITGYLGIATDITAIEEAKEELQILSDKLQKQNKQLLNFAHITSHNLRSPVSNLNTVLYLYKETDDAEEKNVLCGHMETVIRHLTETLDYLVNSLKIQEDKGKEREWLAFDEVFNKTKEIFVGAILESDAMVTADFSLAPRLHYPKTYLESIMLNLLSNALKYRSVDRAPIITFQSNITANGVCLKVSDNGLGIDLNKHGDKLFGLNKTFHRHAEAKGIGLFMTKIQIEAMGGSISTESEVNKGTTFTIHF